MTLTDDDRAELTRLEESLWREATRFDPAHMERVLADDFVEFGRSGRVYTRAACLAIPAGPIGARLPLAELAVDAIGTDAALVTYVGEVAADGRLERANRSSIWSRIDGRWRLRFHQGTPRD